MLVYLHPEHLFVWVQVDLHYPVTYLFRPPTSRLRSLSSPRISYIVHYSLLYPIPFLFALQSHYLGL
jgi:hypothetical protein